MSTLSGDQSRRSRRNPDTDGDGLTDGREVHETYTSPVLADTDADGSPMPATSTALSASADSIRFRVDSDQDRLYDSDEELMGLDPERCRH